VAQVKRSTCVTTIRRQKVEVLHVLALRRRLWPARSQNAPSMVSGVIGQTGPSAARSVVQDVMTANVRSRCSLSMEANQSLAQTKKRKAVRTNLALLPVRYLIGKILASVPSVVEVGR
jgi:hypothetical protein